MANGSSGLVKGQNPIQSILFHFCNFICSIISHNISVHLSTIIIQMLIFLYLNVFCFLIYRALLILLLYYFKYFLLKMFSIAVLDAVSFLYKWTPIRTMEGGLRPVKKPHLYQYNFFADILARGEENIIVEIFIRKNLN